MGATVGDGGVAPARVEGSICRDRGDLCVAEVWSSGSGSTGAPPTVLPIAGPREPSSIGLEPMAPCMDDRSPAHCPSLGYPAPVRQHPPWHIAMPGAGAIQPINGAPLARSAQAPCPTCAGLRPFRAETCPRHVSGMPFTFHCQAPGDRFRREKVFAWRGDAPPAPFRFGRAVF